MEQPEATNQPETTPETQSPSDPIADIAKRFNIEETAAEFRNDSKQTPAPEPEPTPPATPDPYDPEALKSYLASQAAGTTALQSQVQQLAQFIGQAQAKEAAKALREDISEAVKAVDEIAKIGKPKVVEAYLDGVVREDPKALAIWNNRHKNPAALKEMLKVLGKRAAEDFSVKVDPQLVEAQRARKAAQQTNATTKEVNPDDELGSLQGNDFERAWERLKQSVQ